VQRRRCIAGCHQRPLQPLKRRERRRAIDVRQIGGVMIGAGMYRALWRWIERAGGGGDLLSVACDGWATAKKISNGTSWLSVKRG
jgi:hypothetical protein